MNPPEFKIPEPEPETGLGLWISKILYWVEELFEDKNKPKSSSACCGSYRCKIDDDALAQWKMKDRH